MLKKSFHRYLVFMVIVAAASASVAQEEKINAAFTITSPDYLLSDPDMSGYRMSSRAIQTWPLSPKDGALIAIAGVRQVWLSSQGKELIVCYGNFDSPAIALDAAALFMSAKRAPSQDRAYKWQKNLDRSWVLSAEGKEVIVFVRGNNTIAVESRIDSVEDRTNLETTILKVLGKIAMSQKSRGQAARDKEPRSETCSESAAAMSPPKPIDDSSWIKYGEPLSDAKLYYDKESIRKTCNNVVKVWLKSEVDTSRFKDLSRGYVKSKHLLHEVDCGRKKGRYPLIREYLTNGKEESRSDDQWRRIGWREDEANLYRVLCPNEPQPESLCRNGQQRSAGMPISGEAGRIFKTHEELIASFIDALNSNDETKLKQTVHPASLREITPENSIFYEETFKEELGYLIPPDAIITFTKLENPETFLIEPDSDRYCYPIKPTHRFSVQFNNTPSTGRTITKYVLETDSGWLIVLPRPKEKYVQDLLLMEKRRLENEKYADELVRAMDKAVYDKIVEYLRQQDMEKAISTFQQQSISDRDKSYSVFAVKRIITKESLNVRGVSAE